MGFSRQDTGVGCHGVLQGTLSNPGIEPVSCISCIAGRFFTAEPLGKPKYHHIGLVFLGTEQQIGIKLFWKSMLDFFFAFVFVIVLVQTEPSSSRSINNVLFIKFSKYQPSPPHFTVILLIGKCSCLIHELFSRLFCSQENGSWNRPTWNRLPIIPSYLGWWQQFDVSGH